MATNQQQSDAGMTRKPRRLVLCFDGTDNEFKADETDTNIVKLYELLDRESPTQYHYYQPGVGTYVPGKLDNKKGGLKDKIAKLQDSGFGTYFVNHVVSGYQFLMRYYAQGDKIYIFGFSRGAYTARFLSKMIDSIGLLSMGNEEMVCFAWDAFSDFQTNRNSGDEAARTEALMNQFKSNFCRTGEATGEKVQVHFLGLFDCVNSVAAFLSAKDMPMPMPHEKEKIVLPAKYVRHAVSIHERRAMFQPVLFDPNPKGGAGPTDGTTSLVERWFAGNHGDVGGGWRSYPAAKGEESYLLSDIPLKWMIEQVKEVDEAAQLQGDDNILDWRGPFPPVQVLVEGKLKTVRSGNWQAIYDHARDQIDSWALKQDLSSEDLNKRTVEKARKSVHDMLQHRTMGPDTTRWTGWFSLVSWWLLETVALPRWVGVRATEDRSQRLYKTTYELNRGRAREIPHGACKHWSVPKLRACQVKGDAALGWLRYAADEKIKWTDPEPPKPSN